MLTDTTCENINFRYLRNAVGNNPRLVPAIAVYKDKQVKSIQYFINAYLITRTCNM